MRQIRTAVLALIIFINLGLLVVFANGLNTFENPATPLSPEDRLVNANRTGEVTHGWEDFNRTVEGQRVHANFQTNSNSCASCHMTHTSPGINLVFQNSGYNTCMSCHDGSVPKAYNVLNGTTPSGSTTPGGRFSEDLLPDGSVSYHLSTGARTHGDAPGSRITRRGVSVAGDWSRPLTCASCHGTHGSYSERHLHYNPNNVVMREESLQNATLVALGGGRYGLHVDYQHLVPWFYQRDENDKPVTVAVYNSGGVDITEQFSINYLKGEITQVIGLDTPASVSFRTAYVIGMDILNLYSTTETESVTYKSGVSQFCISCHVAYYDKSEVDVFSWHDRFYHLLGVDVSGLLTDTQAAALALELRDGGKYITCLSCHFAHGTDRSLLRRSVGENWKSNGELSELDISHAPENTVNLRFYNPENGDGYGGRFEVCYLCHGEFRYNPAVAVTNPVSNGSVVPGSFQDIIITMADTGMILDDATINSDTLIVTNGVTPVDGAYSYNSELGQIRFTPLAPWENGEKYTVTLTAGIKSRIGGSLTGYSFDFYSSLEVSLTSPQGANVPLSSIIEAEFSADVNENTVTPESGALTVSYFDGQSVIYIPGDRFVSGNTVSFLPINPLPAGAEITVWLKGGTGGILSVSGAPMESDFQWTFTTIP